MPYSSDRSPRIHTSMVVKYSGVPTRLPLRSAGDAIPRSVRTKIAECRNARDRNTGIAVYCALP